MKAIITPGYGSPTILETREVATPTPGEHELLVEVRATVVTEGDRRLRSADFPGVTALPGRLMMGVFAPRASIQGTMFAGRVVGVGSGVTDFAVGDDVFGGVDHGAYAEFLTVSEEGRVAKIPDGVTYEEAVDVPYGGVTALQFLRDVGEVKPGDHVLVVGASGGVGRYAVQLAKQMGATVTGVCSARNAEFVRTLGADHVIDYTTQDFTTNGERYDVIFDIADATTFSKCRRSLTPTGRYMTLYVSIGVLIWMALTALGGGPRALAGVALGTREDIEKLRDLLADGVLRPAIAARYEFDRITDAHAAAEAPRAPGSVVITFGASSAQSRPDMTPLRPSGADMNRIRTGSVPA